MATLQISEFKRLAVDANGNVLAAGDMSGAVFQTPVTYTTSTQSAVLSDDTRFVRLIADADCHVLFGTSPTATATHTRLEANVAEYFGVGPHAGLMKIAAYDGSS